MTPAEKGMKGAIARAEEIVSEKGEAFMLSQFDNPANPEIHQKTKTYTLLNEMVEMIRYDSDELFLAIQRDNPYVEKTKQDFFGAVKDLENFLSEKKAK